MFTDAGAALSLLDINGVLESPSSSMAADGPVFLIGRVTADNLSPGRWRGRYLVCQQRLPGGALTTSSNTLYHKSVHQDYCPKSMCSLRLFCFQSLSIEIVRWLRTDTGGKQRVAAVGGRGMDL